MLMIVVILFVYIDISVYTRVIDTIDRFVTRGKRAMVTASSVENIVTCNVVLFRLIGACVHIVFWCVFFRSH